MYYIFFVYFITSIKCTNVEDLKQILSQKESIEWISGMVAPASHSSYCNFCCINILVETIGKNCGSHTLCKYKENVTGPLCKGYIPIKLTSMEKEVIVDAHNTLRNFVAGGLELRGNPGPQPSAANMKLIEWNDELANVAERWSAQCIYNNDECRDLEQFPVGQNIAKGNLATDNELGFIKNWYDQVALFHNGEVRKFRLKYQEKHPAFKYTQIIWADTYQIGCARAVFQILKNSVFSYREHFFCNYGPTGNIPNQPVYLSGNPCSMCPEGTTCSIKYPGLCKAELISNLNDDVRSVNKYPVNSCVSLRVGLIRHLFYLYIFFVCYYVQKDIFKYI